MKRISFNRPIIERAVGHGSVPEYSSQLRILLAEQKPCHLVIIYSMIIYHIGKYPIIIFITS